MVFGHRGTAPPSPVGQFKDDKKHGEGTNFEANGNKYIGQWKGGKCPRCARTQSGPRTARTKAQ